MNGITGFGSRGEPKKTLTNRKPAGKACVWMVLPAKGLFDCFRHMGFRHKSEAETDEDNGFGAIVTHRTNFVNCIPFTHD